MVGASAVAAAATTVTTAAARVAVMDDLTIAIDAL
jgi:hypothetical protein